MSSVAVSFGDVVKLDDDRVGTVRYIGGTEFNAGVIYYGIHLKPRVFEYDEFLLKDMERKHYFNCPKNHGLFVERSEIKSVIRKHVSSASYSYNQTVKVQNFGKGTVKYIGLTHFAYTYWYGIELEHNMLQIQGSQQNQNNCLYQISPNEENIYFDSDPKKSIFVRSNQLRRMKVIKQPIFYGEDNKNAIATDGNDQYISKMLCAMMDSLRIPQKARPAIMNMNQANKIQLIQQWFITGKKTYTLTENEKKQISEPESQKPVRPQRVVYSHDTYSFDFKSKPFGLVFAITKDKKNLYVKKVDSDSAGANGNVIVGSVLMKFEQELVLDLGAKIVYKRFKKYLHRLPLQITFRIVNHENNDYEIESEKKVDTNDEAKHKTNVQDKQLSDDMKKRKKRVSGIVVSESNSDTLFNGCNIEKVKSKKKSKQKKISATKKKNQKTKERYKHNENRNRKKKRNISKKTSVKKQIAENRNTSNTKPVKNKQKSKKISKKATKNNAKAISGHATHQKKRKRKKKQLTQ